MHGLTKLLPIFVSLLCVLSLCARAVQAQGVLGEPGESARAGSASSYEGALEAALDAHAKGDLDRAWRAMSLAHELRPSARTLRGLGVIAAARGDYLEANRRLSASLHDSRMALTDILRDSVESLRKECRARLARLRIVLTPPDATLRIDGALAETDGSGAIWVAAGAHSVEAAAPGYLSQRWTQDFHAGQKESLRIALAPEPEIAEAPLGASLTEAKAGVPPDGGGTGGAGPDHSLPRRWQWGLLGAGIATASAALATWAIARRRFDSIANVCATEGCSEDDAQARWARQNLGPLTTSARALAGVGAAAAATAAGIYLWRRKRGHGESRATLHVGVAGLTLTVLR